MLGSFSASRNHRWLTSIVQSPNDLLSPLDETWGWNLKLNGNYNMPYSIALSGSFVAVNGLKGQRTAQFSGLPSSGTVTLRMEPFGQEQGPTRTLLTVRAGRDFPVTSKSRLRLSVDVLNALNHASPWTISYLAGPTFNQWSDIDSPRIARLSATFTF